jgi:pilus assembly protein CpaE
VLVIGHSNDIGFYRELMRRGISEYVVAPIDITPLIAAISNIYRDSSAGKLGKVYGFIGTKGGVGSSTVAHNVAWSISQRLRSGVVVIDMDLPFGTASLNFNLDAGQGVADAIQDSSRLDEVLFDRLLTKCDDNLSLLAAPTVLDRSYDLDAHAFSSLLEVSQSTVPFTILDIPHVWTSWARNALLMVDEILITAAPDLANLRNAKNLIGFLKQARPHDPPPKLIVNQVGVTKRPEIKLNEFTRALEVEPFASIAFDAQLFGLAANNGQMVGAASAKSPASQAFARIADSLAGRKEAQQSRKGLPDLRTLLRRPK